METNIDPEIRQTWQVPAYSVAEISSKRHKYCVCIFVINEGEKIRKQLIKMQALTSIIDIIIADGGSTDNSLDRQFLKSVNVCTLLTKQDQGKLSSQMRIAFAYALEKGYQGIIVIDGNNKDDTTAITKFITHLDQGWDHLQGSRFIKGGRGINTPWLRYLAIRLIHAPLISLAAGRVYTDTTNGFRGYSRQLLLDSRVNPFREIFSDYELHYYLSIRASRLGYRIKELPVTRQYPLNQPIPTKISPIKGNLKIILTLIKACCHRFNPTEK
ncbi:glycosyltransferase family 2 protein [Gloeocapsa sp. PCC 73106]|uniref:glycosyltransferase family 2 protein n=1 Tax=Gloeocapsa sp. PCC 73106 TaxID=102232 RepID=UPI0002ACE233|nr:glycosyltransferase family 2 protein [Gloeocapsa sp. PCC 73106]ELR97348.1 putative glycosyltransferase [Gloeocapsa sp. PCC 73106]